jgi:hypothetical protein
VAPPSDTPKKKGKRREKKGKEGKRREKKGKEGKRVATLKIFVSSVAGSSSTPQALRGYHSKAAEAAVCAELEIGRHKLVSDNLN